MENKTCWFNFYGLSYSSLSPIFLWEFISTSFRAILAVTSVAYMEQTLFFVFLFLNVYLQHIWNRLKQVYPIIYYLNRYNVVKQINAFSLYAINVQLGIIFGYQFWTNLATFFFSQNEMNLFISSFCLAIGLVCWRKKTGDGTSRTREEAQLFAAEFSLKNLVGKNIQYSSCK